jgi:hypothetical protein
MPIKKIAERLGTTMPELDASVQRLNQFASEYLAFVRLVRLGE